MSDLEAELGFRLFDRRAPRIHLTPAGERLSALATPLVEALDRLPDTFSEQHWGRASGPLAIATGQSVALAVLPEYLKCFAERHPGVDVSLRIGSGRRRLDWLRAFEVEVAFVAVDAVPSDLEFRPLFSSEIVAIVPQDHPLGGRASVELGELAAELFDRRGPRLALTRAGERLDGIVRPLLEAVERLPGSLASPGTGLGTLHDGQRVGYELRPGRNGSFSVEDLSATD